MPPHERNPICIKDSEHIAELIKLRFDASDARQESTSKLFTKELGEIKEQVLYTNGRTRKLEDYHLEQIAINKELLEFVVYQKRYNDSKDKDSEDLKDNLRFVLWLQKNWIPIVTIIISIITVYITIKPNDNETNSQHQQTNTSQHREVNWSSGGSTSLFGNNY